MDSIQTSYTRAQLAAAVDEAHAALHEWIEADGSPLPGEVAAIERAHEALHRVGAGLPRVGCATPDPEAQAIYADLQAMRDRPLPCGHKIEDIIGGTDPTTGKPEVTKCGQCLADKQAEREAAPRTPETVLRAMLRAYEAALFAAHVAYMRGDKTFDSARRVDRLAADTDAVRGAAAWVAAGNADVGLSEYRLADYKARLAGKRRPNAPPLEV